MDDAEFAAAVEPHRRELRMHAYRILGSMDDADDALQEAMLAAWRGIGGFQGRSSLRAWLYRIVTHAALRTAERRGPRLVSWDAAPPRRPGDDVGEPEAAAWLEPLLDQDPGVLAERRERLHLAFVAAAQRLPATQRATLMLREVLGFSAAETADLLDTTPASINSALQRARATLQQTAGPAPIGPITAADRAAADAFVAAFERADVDALVGLLADDVRFTMPPLPAWFSGRDDVAAFLRDRVFALQWRILPITINGVPGFAGYSSPTPEGPFPLGLVTAVSTANGRVDWLASFLDPDRVNRLGLPPSLDGFPVHR